MRVPNVKEQSHGIFPIEQPVLVSIVVAIEQPVIFGIIVAAVGCLRGLQTKTGAGAVGESTTSSVVSGIVLIAFIDGLFGVIFYMLGI